MSHKLQVLEHDSDEKIIWWNQEKMWLVICMPHVITM